MQKNMFRLDACFRLNLSGAPENAPDHVLEGESQLCIRDSC